MEDALIIFVRKPVLGKVKTRLAADIGDKLAYSVYVRLLEYTKKLTAHLQVSKFVYYADEVEMNDLWNGMTKRLQSDGDLGSRMEIAFHEVFADGFKKILIIGSDCAELTGSILLDAWEALDQHEVVIGPAEDGGYYLLGLKENIPEIFRNKPWSRNNLLEETKKSLEGKLIKFLPTLSDVDVIEDLERVGWLRDILEKENKK